MRPRSWERAALACHDVLAAACMALVLCAAWPAPALAYVDPSVMTYTIQALAGVAIALSAVLGVVFRRTRRALMRLFHIDENANKEKEPPVQRVCADTPEGQAQLAQADVAARAAKERLNAQPKAKALSWPQRFARALLASVFLVATLFVVAPLEVVGQSTSGLLFGFYDILPLVLIAGAVGSLALALVLSAVRGRAFEVASAVVVGVGICCYVQALFMNTALPVADGASLDLSQFVPITVVSLIVWVAILAFMVLLALKRARMQRIVGAVACVCLLIVQTVGVVSVATDRHTLETFHRDGAVATQEGLYSLSPEKNVVVFILDTYDERYLNQVLESDPAALSEFTGFTCFRNAAPAMVPTRYAVPYLLTGRTPDGSQDFREFTHTWFKESSFLADIRDQGFDMGVYTDSMGTDILNVEPYARNIHRGAVPLNVPQMLMELDRVALYRDMPWVLKPAFWFTTDDLNHALGQEGNPDSKPYSVDDARFMDTLDARGLSLDDNAKDFRFIHMLGPHKPFTLDARGHAPGGPTSLEEQARGSLEIVEEYLRQMKRLGVYDAATVIVTADHGNWQNVPEGMDEPTSVIMLVKPAETPEEAAQPLQMSEVPTGLVDYPATVIEAVGGDASKYGPTVFQVPPGPRDRYYWHTTTDYHEDTDWTQYRINGDVLNYDDWEKTGKVIEIPHR